MLNRDTDVLQNHSAVGAFVAYNLETAQGIISAAETTEHPVLLQPGLSAFKHAGKIRAKIALALAESTDTQIGVHLDHSRSLGEIDEYLRLGYISIMIDGSHFPYADNIALTREATRRAPDHGAWAEAELGAVAGDEDVSIRSAAGEMTDPQQAADFVEQTGIDALQSPLATSTAEPRRASAIVAPVDVTVVMRI